MMIPIRCFSCGFPVSAFYEELKKAKESEESMEKILDKMGITRYCCRRMFLTQLDLLEEVSQFKK